MLGRRNAELRNEFALPGHLKVANFVDDDGSNNADSEEHNSDSQKPASGEIEVEDDWQSPQCRPQTSLSKTRLWRN